MRERVLLLLTYRKNRHLLEAHLGGRYEVVVAEGPDDLEAPFDLGVVDGRALDAHRDAVDARREREAPIFLPFLLITSRRNVGYVTRHLWRTVDELILTPIEKVELDARIAILLRARRLSRELAAALQAKAKAEARYRRLVETPLVAFWETDAEGRFQFVNRLHLEMTGYGSLEEVQQRTLLDCIAPEDQEWLAERLRQHRDHELEADVVEARILRKDGSFIHVLVAPAAIYDEKGHLIGIVGAMMDITERKRLEQQLRDQVQEYRRLVRLMANREIRMAELKEVIRQLRQQLLDAGIKPVADDPLKEK